ncbi:MAG: hypothetical protein GY953_19190, partial [bacterium]|nr:hypothetical protein [bacterium]
MIRKILLVVLPITVLGAGAYATKSIIESREEPAKVVREIEPPLVEVMEARARRIGLTVVAQGTVAPRTESELVPEVSGRVLKMSPALVVGGFFTTGDVLLEIDAREYELAVIRARAAIEQTKLGLAIEEREAEVAAREW